MATSLRSSLMLLAGLIPLQACHTWQVQRVTPETLLTAPSPPSRVRLRIKDSTRVILLEPRLAGDSVQGLLAANGRRDSVSVPVGAISEVAVRRFSAGKTAGLVAASTVGLFAVAAIGCEMAGGCGPDFSGMSLGY
jgi:hypothetical protein